MFLIFQKHYQLGKNIIRIKRINTHTQESEREKKYCVCLYKFHPQVVAEENNNGWRKGK